MTTKNLANICKIVLALTTDFLLLSIDLRFLDEYASGFMSSGKWLSSDKLIVCCVLNDWWHEGDIYYRTIAQIQVNWHQLLRFFYTHTHTQRLATNFQWWFQTSQLLGPLGSFHTSGPVSFPPLSWSRGPSLALMTFLPVPPVSKYPPGCEFLCVPALHRSKSHAI